MPPIIIRIVASIYDCISVRHVSVAVLAQATVSSVGVPSVVRLAMRYPISSSVAICNRVLDWMDAHEDSLPICVRKQRCCNPSVAQRAETNLRRQF